MRSQVVVMAAVALMMLTGCAAGPNPLESHLAMGMVAGFLLGLWHGMICPIALVISWFNPNVSIYEVHNNGGWYDTAFVIGAGAWGLLGGGGRNRNRKSS